MRKIIVIALLMLAMCSCMTTYIVKDQSEFVLLNELNLSPGEKLKLHWSTFRNSEFAIFDSRSEKYFYQKDYDYSKILNK